MIKDGSDLTDEEVLQNFLLDIDCLDELVPWTKRFNLFDVLKISRTEIRHSNILGWLLTPNENHGLGDAFLRAIIQCVVQEDDNGRYNILDTLLMDFYSFAVYREWKYIDLLLVSDTEKFLIAIENKIGSHEHDHQLKRYRRMLETDYPNYKKMLLYLTPEGEDPSDCDNWDVLTYRDIAATLSELQNTMDLAPDVLLVIGNYIDVIRRDIVEDEKLIEVCNKIYAKHKRALDLIFEHRTDGRTQLADGIKATLTTLTEEGVICASPFTCSNTNFFVFRTNEMNRYLPPIDTPTSSWGNENVYVYWIAIRENQLCGVFEIGGWNVPEQQMQTMQKMIDLLKPGDKRRENFRYKRLFRTGWYKIEENDSFEDSVSDCVRKVVKELLKKETQLLKQMEMAERTEE